MTKRNIGKFIKKYRKERKLTQAELAAKIGTSRPNIWSWESDRTEPSINDCERLAQFFGVKITDIIGDTEPVDILSDSYIRDFAVFLSVIAPSENRKEYFTQLRKIAEALAK